MSDFFYGFFWLSVYALLPAGIVTVALVGLAAKASERMKP